MPEITPKSPEVIQAQIAAFTAERISHYQDRAHVLGDIGNLATGSLTEISRVPDQIEYEPGANYTIVSVPVGVERTVATPSDYIGFLRDIGGADHEDVEGRAYLLEGYMPFQRPVSLLREELDTLPSRKNHPSYLGSGLTSDVFALQGGGRQLAVRIPRGKGSAIRQAIDGHMAASLRGRGIAGLEQIIAGSYEDGVTVAEMMPGKEVGSLSVEDIESITDDHLEKFIDTIGLAKTRGIDVDPKPSNFLYDQNAGYGIVDYHREFKRSRGKPYELGEVLGLWVPSLIERSGFYGKPLISAPTAENYADELGYHVANLSVMKRYRQIIGKRSDLGVDEKALDRINSKILSLKDVVSNYSDPNWVAVQQEKQAERQRLKLKMAEIVTVDSQMAENFL